MCPKKTTKKAARKKPAAALKKTGLVVIVGRSNAGKSTLLNALVGSKIAITSPKPQTTRDVIHGVVNDERGQIVFADTPGIFKHAPDRLTSILNEKVRESLEGVDAVIYVVDATRHVGDEERLIHRLVAAVDKPKILVFNKSDQHLAYKDEFLAWRDEFDAVIEVSASRGKSLSALVDAVFELLPESEPLYPPDRITNIENRTWVAEMIREKVFLTLNKELPYSVAVKIDEIETREDGLVYIRGRLLTSQARYKKMIIGHGAARIKQIGTMARQELEEVTGKRIFLDLEVEIDERWIDRPL
ncbi:MAG: GTPase Era [Patescibacteria group bacterium]|jgi:GTP-binding protein Era